MTNTTEMEKNMKETVRDMPLVKKISLGGLGASLFVGGVTGLAVLAGLAPEDSLENARPYLTGTAVTSGIAYFCSMIYE